MPKLLKLTGYLIRVLNFEPLANMAMSSAIKLRGKRLDFGDCFNGIAYNPNDKSIVLTGKFWPVYFVIKLI